MLERGPKVSNFPGSERYSDGNQCAHTDRRRKVPPLSGPRVRYLTPTLSGSCGQDNLVYTR